MKRWEYKVVPVSVGVVFSDYSKIEQKLNELGDEGWELVATALGPKMVFKRESGVVASTVKIPPDQRNIWG